MRRLHSCCWLLLSALLCLPNFTSAQRLLSGHRVLVGTLNYCADTGTANVYACSLLETISAYGVGTRYTFKALNANTGASTLNLNSLGVKSIVKVVGGITTPLAANDIRAGQIVDVIYDGTNMQMLSQLGMSTITIASGTIALATAAITSGTCATAQTATATGTLTTDVVLAGFNADVTGVTGYTPATTGALRIDMYPTANTVNFRVCNATADPITPGAVSLNWRVVR